MSLKKLLEQDNIKPHRTSKEEIGNLLKLIKRDMQDAKVEGVSADRRFATAYNAVLQAATILLYCRGYKPKGTGHHFTIFKSMKEILGKEYYDLADYFDACRAKRNITDYSYIGGISESETKELLKEAETFLDKVIDWLKRNYPKFLND